MLSPVHAPKIYHCPTALVGHGGKSVEKRFATLSGLASHVESGACRGGKKTLSKVLSFINEKLAEFGFCEIKMIE